MWVDSGWDASQWCSKSQEKSSNEIDFKLRKKKQFEGFFVVWQTLTISAILEAKKKQ